MRMDKTLCIPTKTIDTGNRLYVMLGGDAAVHYFEVVKMDNTIDLNPPFQILVQVIVMPARLVLTFACRLAEVFAVLSGWGIFVRASLVGPAVAIT